MTTVEMYPYARSNSPAEAGWLTPASRWQDVYCTSLDCLSDHIERCGMSQMVRDVAQVLCVHFDMALWRHRSAQEIRLFPLLRSEEVSELHLIDTVIPHLTGERLALEKVWETLRISLNKLASGQPVMLPSDAVTDFCASYQNHRAKEIECRHAVGMMDL